MAKSTPDLGLATSPTLFYFILFYIFSLVYLTPCSLASFAGPWHLLFPHPEYFSQIVIYGALLWVIHTSGQMFASAEKPSQVTAIQLGSLSTNCKWHILVFKNVHMCMLVCVCLRACESLNMTSDVISCMPGIFFHVFWFWGRIS